MGVEPTTAFTAPDFESAGNRVNPEENEGFLNGAAVGAAVKTETAAIDPELQYLIEAWPTLPDAVKAFIAATVRTSLRL